jgi:hypothetical protein
MSSSLPDNTVRIFSARLPRTKHTVYNCQRNHLPNLVCQFSLIYFVPFLYLIIILLDLWCQIQIVSSISVNFFAYSDYPIQSVALYPMANLATPTPQQPLPVHSFPDDFADNPDFYVQGYPKLSYFFSQCPRYFHLRRFSALSIRVQLYRQHELVLLERSLMELEGKEDKLYCTDYEHMKTGSKKEHVKDSEQRNLYEIIKTELKEYGMKNRETTYLTLGD